MKTYVIIKNIDQTVESYHLRLWEADSRLRQLEPLQYTLIQLSGPYVYEGFHNYKKEFNGYKIYKI